MQRRNTGARYALPGLWFSESEALALLTMEHLLSSLDDGGLIGPHSIVQRTRRGCMPSFHTSTFLQSPSRHPSPMRHCG